MAGPLSLFLTLVVFRTTLIGTQLLEYGHLPSQDPPFDAGNSSISQQLAKPNKILVKRRGEKAGQMLPCSTLLYRDEVPDGVAVAGSGVHWPLFPADGGYQWFVPN